jgi:hypothetical protein
MANMNCAVYFRENGSSKIYSIKQAKGRVGSYGIRWYEGKRQRQKIHRYIPRCFCRETQASGEGERVIVVLRSQ